MTDASRKPSRSWPFIAEEIKRENDPELILRLVEELNRSIAARGIERALADSQQRAALRRAA
jgi:hypothetical protein